MVKNKMIYNGLCCKVNTKAAFVDMYMENPDTSADMMMRAMYEAACADRLYPVGESKDGFMTLRMELDEEKREKIYEDVFERRLRDGAESRLTDVQKKLLEPIRMMHKKEVRVEVLPFVVYGIVRNERCRNSLKKVSTDCAAEGLEAFRSSEYDTGAFLGKFLLEERRAAKIVTGFLLLLRREEDDKRYRMVMDIIYAGYRSAKNVIKKLDRLDGERYRDAGYGDCEIRMELSRMVIQMVIAEDLGIPVVYDYRFCEVVCMLILYEEEFFQVCEDKSMDIKEGKRIYRKFLREHQDPGTYYVSAFLENESHKTAELESKMEQLFRLFDIELEALAGVHIEKWEAEMICSIFEEKDWERYKELLLTANLCKYIQQIELLYEDDIPEEIQYRRACEESAVKNMEYEMKRMEQRISELEKQRKAKESELIETECQVERLKRELMKKEEKYEKESTELRNLRDYLFHPKEDRKEKKEDRPDIGRLGRSVVIGGHRNWQKKMQQCLPGSQFLTYDNMNFDPTVLRNKKYIIVNTDILKHGLYYKVMNERKKEQKILYVHGNNVERTLREISDQLQ